MYPFGHTVRNHFAKYISQALRRSKFASQHTKLMVFLGTPHRGSVSADWGQIASNMARSARQDWKQKIPETLEVNNEFLDSIQEEFKTIVYENNIKVHSFQEARGISGMNGSQDKVHFSKSPNFSILTLLIDM